MHQNKNLFIFGGTSVYKENKKIFVKKPFETYLKYFKKNFSKVNWIVPNTSPIKFNNSIDSLDINIKTYNKNILNIIYINIYILFLFLKLRNKFYLIYFNSPFLFPVFFLLNNLSIKTMSYVGIDHLDLKKNNKLNTFPFWKNYYYFYLHHTLKKSNIVLARGSKIKNYCKKYNNNVFLTEPIGWNINNNLNYDKFKKKYKSLNKLKILFVGKILESKGIFLLLHAFLQLQSIYKDISFNIIGDGPDKYKLEKLIRLNDKINFHGWIDDDEKIKRIFSHSNLLVCPTLPGYPEGVPRVISEALSTFTMVLSSDVGGINNEFINNSPILLFKGGNIISLKNKIKKIINNNFDIKETYELIKNYNKNRIESYKQHYSMLVSKKIDE